MESSSAAGSSRSVGRAKIAARIQRVPFAELGYTHQRPRTTKGDYTDASFRIELPTKDANGNPRYVYIHLDTFTPTRRTRKPNAREQRQHNKLLYNERGYAFIVRVPKLGENEALDKLAWDNYIWNLMMHIKKGIENGAFDNPRNAHKVEDLFRPIKRR